jgi:hypothetical protein
MAMDAIYDKLYKGEHIEKFCKDISQFISAGSPLIEAVVDIMVWANPVYFDAIFPHIPSPIAAKIAQALKKVQTLETMVSLQKDRKTSKDYYVNDAIDSKK